MNIGTTELILILALALFLYGAKLPEITRALGKGYREFRNSFDGLKNDLTKQVTDIAKDTGIKDIDKIYTAAAEIPESKEDNLSIKGNDNLAG